jgi:hypothetical protein
MALSNVCQVQVACTFTAMKHASEKTINIYQHAPYEPISDPNIITIPVHLDLVYQLTIRKPKENE